MRGATHDDRTRALPGRRARLARGRILVRPLPGRRPRQRLARLRVAVRRGPGARHARSCGCHSHPARAPRRRQLRVGRGLLRRGRPPPQRKAGEAPVTTRRLDAWTWAGITVTATAAAAASAGAQHHLAVAAGWGNTTGWLLPGCVDTLAAVAARVWLDQAAPEAARRYARTVALGAVAVSLALNAAGHAVSAGLVAVSVPLLVAVGAVPAASLAATVHLAAIRTTPLPPRRQRTRSRANITATEQPASATGRATATPPAAPTGSGSGSATDTRTTTAAIATGSGNVTPMLRGDTATERARAHWQHERAQGRTPTGAELARVADCSASMGRKLAHEFRTTDAADAKESAR
ncbi:MAG: DUF2637 domain-containing protein [Propionibacteriales bacterium]|nr:DUF2637 domain-containing protein [Propionibacteriales bacterium]